MQGYITDWDEWKDKRRGMTNHNQANQTEQGYAAISSEKRKGKKTK